MKNRTGIAAIVLSVISLVVAVAALTTAKSSGTASGNATVSGDTATQYVMYVGTNDKDTYKPEHSNEEALEIVDTICLKYFGGYTLQEATGSWTDETNNVTHEYTLVCYIDGTDKSVVYEAADEIIEALNQNTVLIEENEIRMEYYGGKQ